MEKEYNFRKPKTRAILRDNSLTLIRGDHDLMIHPGMRGETVVLFKSVTEIKFQKPKLRGISSSRRLGRVFSERLGKWISLRTRSSLTKMSSRTFSRLSFMRSQRSCKSVSNLSASEKLIKIKTRETAV